MDNCAVVSSNLRSQILNQPKIDSAFSLTGLFVALVAAVISLRWLCKPENENAKAIKAFPYLIGLVLGALGVLVLTMCSLSSVTNLIRATYTPDAYVFNVTRPLAR